MEVLKEIYQFLEANNILSLLISVVMSFLAMLLVMIKTRTSAIQKKAVSNGNINAGDYIVLIPSLNIRVSLASCTVKLSSLLTKEEAAKYKEVK